MAHSNRQEKKKQRGGLTKNQAMKAGRSAKQQERLREVIAYYERLEKQKGIKVEQTTSKKSRRICMFPSVINRRIGALNRLKATNVTHHTDLNKSRIEREIKTLKQRV